MKNMNLILTLLIGILLLPNCQKENAPPNDKDDKTNETNDTVSISNWVLVSKERMVSGKIIYYFPTESDTLFPVTLTFYNNNQICGFHDANEYEGNYTINNNDLSFSNISTTDVSDTKWYWDFIERLGQISNYSIIKSDTLKLYNQTGDLTIVLLKKQAFNNLYFNIDSLYSHFSTHCILDTSNKTNVLQGTSWVLCHIESQKSTSLEIEFPPNDDEYPITFSIYDHDSIYGFHDANVYQGYCSINSTNIEIFDMIQTDIGDIDWYWNYIGGFSEMSKIIFFNLDSLKLYNQDSSLIYNYLGKELFNQNYFNIDSIYSNL